MVACSIKLLQALTSILLSISVELLMTDGSSAIGKEALVLKQMFG